jgi:hypothetical protein
VSGIYRKKVERLTEALNTPEDRNEAAEAIWALVEKITRRPGPNRGEIDATLQGELGTILGWIEGGGVQAVFRSSTWEPTVLATNNNWPMPCARRAPSLRAIFRRPGRGRCKKVKGLIAANDFLGRRARAAASNSYSRDPLPQLRGIRDAVRGRTCCSTFLFLQISP